MNRTSRRTARHAGSSTTPQSRRCDLARPCSSGTVLGPPGTDVGAAALPPSTGCFAKTRLQPPARHSYRCDGRDPSATSPATRCALLLPGHTRSWDASPTAAARRDGRGDRASRSHQPGVPQASGTSISRSSSTTPSRYTVGRLRSPTRLGASAASRPSRSPLPNSRRFGIRIDRVLTDNGMAVHGDPGRMRRRSPGSVPATGGPRPLPAGRPTARRSELIQTLPQRVGVCPAVPIERRARGSTPGVCRLLQSPAAPHGARRAVTPRRCQQRP